jgi:hypothetical protein
MTWLTIRRVINGNICIFVYACVPIRGHSWLQIVQINLMMSFAGFNFQAKKRMQRILR